MKNYAVILKAVVVGDEDGHAANYLRSVIDRAVALTSDAMTESDVCRNVVSASDTIEVDDDLAAISETPSSAGVNEALYTMMKAVAVCQIDDEREQEKGNR